jgi:hypothetical protein
VSASFQVPATGQQLHQVRHRQHPAGVDGGTQLDGERHVLGVPLAQLGNQHFSGPGTRRHPPMVARRPAAWVGLDMRSVWRGLWYGSAIGAGWVAGQYVAEALR